ncbi:MAG: glycogen/starch/alpha-glucan phosphorylase, partial [Oscillospiraceae bacterium]|nr:glycogen/starch/alpha-glucan phosphorylase [Oscillospiraceae bacterium]
ISPAGLEASGTGNMKLMLNGAVTLGTLDGANVDIAQEAGHANEYIFGATVDDINLIKGKYLAKKFYDDHSDLRRALDTMVNGTIETDSGIREVYNKLINWGPSSDQYYLLNDYNSYIAAKLRANAEYADRLSFGRKCLMNVASAAKFSSDRTIRQYASEIWHIEPTVR